MKIQGATKDERFLIKHLLSDYPTTDLTVKVVKNKKGVATWKPSVTTIEVRQGLAQIHFVSCLMHELQHYVQCLTNKPYSEREAQQFEVTNVNRLFGTNWKLEPQRRSRNYYVQGKLDRVVNYNAKYMKVVRQQGDECKLIKEEFRSPHINEMSQVIHSLQSLVQLIVNQQTTEGKEGELMLK